MESGADIKVLLLIKLKAANDEILVGSNTLQPCYAAMLRNCNDAVPKFFLDQGQ